MSNQNKKVNLDTRKSRPQTLGASFGNLLQSFGIRASDSDLSANFSAIVGNQIANMATVVAVKMTRNNKFNIVLRPSTPAFALELSYQVNDICEKINNYYGRDAVEKITIRK